MRHTRPGTPAPRAALFGRSWTSRSWLWPPCVSWSTRIVRTVRRIRTTERSERSELAAQCLARFLDHPIAVHGRLRHACTAKSVGHRLMAGDGFSRGSRFEHAGRGLRHEDPGAKF